MSVIAVFIALGGVALAATQLPKNSVGARQIKAGAVRSAEVKDHSLKSKDFATPALPAGPRGPQGDQGTAGPTGPAGAAGIDGADAVQVFAFVRTGGCCGGAPALNPPQLQNAHGVTAATVDGTGQYSVTLDTSQLPGGDANNCVPMVSLASGDSAGPMAGEIGVSHGSGLSKSKLAIFYRNSAGALAELNNGGGSAGFSIALFC
jgi:hypothetical protein